MCTLNERTALRVRVARRSATGTARAARVLYNADLDLDHSGHCASMFRLAMLCTGVAVHLNVGRRSHADGESAVRPR